jgi:hypothetical protein
VLVGLEKLSRGWNRFRPSGRATRLAAVDLPLRPASRSAALSRGAGAPVPESLARTLAQFERRGRLPFFEEETLDRESWLAILLGLGMLPRALDPRVSPDEVENGLAAMRRQADSLATLPARLPAYRDYLARMATVPAGTSRRG